MADGGRGRERFVRCEPKRRLIELYNKYGEIFDRSTGGEADREIYSERSATSPDHSVPTTTNLPLFQLD